MLHFASFLHLHGCRPCIVRFRKRKWKQKRKRIQNRIGVRVRRLTNSDNKIGDELTVKKRGFASQSTCIVKSQIGFVWITVQRGKHNKLPAFVNSKSIKKIMDRNHTMPSTAKSIEETIMCPLLSTQCCKTIKLFIRWHSVIHKRGITRI